MSWIENRSKIDIEIAECYSQIEELQNKIILLRKKQKEEERLDNLAKTLNKLPRCGKCVKEMFCSKDKDNDNKCPDYKRDPPDGGFYG